MPAERSIADIAADIARTSLPALVVDTCVWLDIVRCAWRAKPRIAAIAIQFIEAHLAGELFLCAPSILQKEAARNRAEVEGEARRKAREVDESMIHYRQAVANAGGNYPHSAAYSHESLIPSLMSLHDRFLATCIHILPEDMNKAAAFARASDNRRPARKGGGANDCLLFEEFRSLAQIVPAAHPLVLPTTNPDDFTDKSKAGAVHQDITDGLAGTKAQLCLDWDWAAKLILPAARLKSI
jgi:hypothetical protein